MESDCSPCGALPQCSVRLERQEHTAIPFHHLSVSNLPPTDLELSDIQTTILPVLDQDILAVDAAVTAAPLALESLEHERVALENIKRNYENIISTQRRIPPEVWSEIFLYGHFSDSLYPDEVFHWPSRTIWQLSQVCQAWRNLALSLHSCWSSIVLEFPLDWPASERDVELLASVLERSHQHLLDITLITHSTEDLPFPCRMREKVYAESHRWRTARLLDYQVKSDLLYAPLRGRLPQLELLHFQCVGGMKSDVAVISAFKDCPRLVTVALSGADPRMVELPVKQITCLHLLDHLPYWHVDDFRVYVGLIGQCPLLDTLRVDFTERAQGSSLQSLTLPSLRDLSATYPRLLDALVLPRLEIAALDEKLSTLNPETLYSFYCLIQRSNCASNLTELRINRASLTLQHSEPHLLLAILSQTTKLATLQLEASVYDFQHDCPDGWSLTQIMDVMSALQVVPGHTVTFLPRLTSLNIKVTGHTDMSYVPYLAPFHDFVSMLKSRRAVNEHGLQQFRFFLRTRHLEYTPAPYQHRPVYDNDEKDVLRGLVGDGMSLHIHFEGVVSFDL